MGDQFALAAVETTEVAFDGFQSDPEKGRVQNMLDELHEYYQQMKTFNEMEASEVFQTLSACSARASEMRSLMNMVDSRRSTAFRTKHIDPFLDECDRQFKIHSRITAINEMEFRMAGGRFT